jgi:hypothetical protein
MSAGVPLAELVDASAGIDHLLFTGIEGMAVRAHFDLQIVSQRRARLERIAAAAVDGNFFVLGMNAGFHGSRRWASLEKWARSVAPKTRPRKKMSYRSWTFFRLAKNAEGVGWNLRMCYVRLSTNFVDNSVDAMVAVPSKPQ